MCKPFFEAVKYRTKFVRELLWGRTLCDELRRQINRKQLQSKRQKEGWF